jgi:holo-[acyl-carrier protein] synthase
MILGVGLDILYLPRLTQLAKRRGLDRLSRRILTDQELKVFRGSYKDSDDSEDRAVRFLAVRWVSCQACILSSSKGPLG